jgi:hypothetical protein
MFHFYGHIIICRDVQLNIPTNNDCFFIHIFLKHPIDWLSSDTWPYHSNPNPGRKQIKKWFDNGRFTGEDNKTFWIILDN